jgi:PAS domain S-box-containing protein
VRRLAALRELAIVDTPPEERFDRITRLAARVLDVPCACIAFVDADREWHKSQVGIDVTEVARPDSLCNHAIGGGATLVVPDVATDPRFADKPMVAKEGLRFYAAEPVRAHGGEVVGALCVAGRQPRDLAAEERADLRALAGTIETELRAVDLRHALAAQRESEEIIQTILRASVTEVVGFDSGGRITFANPAATTTLGWSLEEMLGEIGHDLFHHSHPDGSHYPREECPMSRVLREGEVVHLDDVFWRRDGSSFPVESLTAPLKREGDIVGAVTTFHDIRDRREIDKLKDEFASVMSHELRTPLTSIRASLGLLADTEGLPPEAVRLVATGLANAERLERILNDILDLERLESGAMKLELRDHDVAALVDGATRLVEPAAVAAGVELRVNVRPSKVRGDADRIVQALSKLIANAIDHSPRGAAVTVFAVPEDDRVVFSVIDRGRGIPSRLHGSIFERFTQGDGSDTRERGGAGLGLAIVRGIVESHGGRVWLDSEPGRGSTFAVALPRASDPR